MTYLKTNRKTTIIAIFILFFLVFIKKDKVAEAQNLVPNYSFESYSICPTTWSQLSRCNDWDDWRTTPDYFNSCNTGTVSTPSNARGYQVPSHGVAYISITTYVPSNPNYRELLGAQLTSPLVVGQEYHLQMKVSVSDDYGWASDVGMQFFNSNYSTATPAPLNNTFHLVSATPITDNTNWVIISGNYIATQAYTHVGIGNFNTDANTNYSSAPPGSGGAAHYYIDEIIVEPITSNPVITVNNDTICEGDVATLTATSSITGTSYSWSNGATTNSINVSPTVTTTYTVTGTASGQTGTTSATVVVNPNPVITATANPTSICVGSNSIVSATSSVGGTSYSWNQGLGAGQSHTVSPTVNTTYTVTGTSAAGCTGTSTVTVSVQPNLTPTITANPSQICAGDSSVLTAANVPATSSFAWSTGDITNPITVSPANTTTYQVTATDGSGCTGTADIQVIVSPLPQITITNDTVCDGDYGSLLASGGDSYLWDNGSTQNPLSDNPTQTTTYIVTGTDINGCSNTAQGEILVVPKPQLQMLAVDAHCDQNDGSVEVVASGGTGLYTYEWNTIPPATTAVVDNLYPGTYTVTVSDNGCESTASVVVGNIPGPMAAYSVSPNPTEINNDVQFTDASIGAISWDWDFGDGSFGSGLDPIHAYTNSGTYETWLYIEDDFGCRDSTSVRIVINQLFTFFIPNSFSPDGDNINDIFIPKGTNVDEDRYMMRIYDRWGKLVFENTDINEGWDGSINGVSMHEEEMISNVYSYYFHVYERNTDIDYEYRGTVIIVK